jgi:2'-5' RNA ligase
LSALRFSITNELQGAWQIGGESKFNPHITVGRIKSIKADAEFKILLESYKNTIIQNLHVSEVILYESTLLSSGAVYSPLSTYRLD